jgi:hypothetical protein
LSSHKHRTFASNPSKPSLEITRYHQGFLGKTQPSLDDLKPFLEIRKQHVLAALQWLVAHNRYYHDLEINHSLLSSWPAEFIPEQISANITYVDVSDHTEREGYVANLETDQCPPKKLATPSISAMLPRPPRQLNMDWHISSIKNQMSKT